MQINNTETLLKTQFLNLKATEFEDNKGQKKYWCWAQRPNNIKAVMIVPFIHDGYPDKPPYTPKKKIVVIKEFRIPINDFEWGFPAGLVNDNEDIIEAAKRELKEETGLTIKNVLRCSPYAYNSAGLSDESIATIYVEAEGTLSTKELESTESIETFIFDKADVQAKLGNANNKFSAKAWIILDNFVNAFPF